MVDIHSHMLPQIDDGAKTLDVALDMARIAESDGVTELFMTPHYIEDTYSKSKEEVIKATMEFNEELEKQGINITALPGQEVYISPNLVELYKNGEIMTLGDSDYMLIELPMNNLPLYVDHVLYELRILGIMPIIAHPERYSYIIENPNLLREWIIQGNYTQVNLSSLSGYCGNKVKETAEILLRNDMIHFVGSDGHSVRNRTPHFKKHLRLITEIVGEKLKDELVDNNERIFNNLEVEIRKPKICKEENFLISLFKVVLLRSKRVKE